MLEPNSLKKGVIFKYRQAPVQVVDFVHTHKGRGSATVTVKIKNLINNSLRTITLKTSDKLEEADIVYRSADFLYQEKETAYFMDTETYEQIALPSAQIGEKLNFLKSGQNVTILEFNGKPVNINLPPKVELKVTHAEPAVRGNTAEGTVFKPVVLESGYQISAPLFVKQGDVVRINTDTGEYVERAAG